MLLQAAAVLRRRANRLMRPPPLNSSSTEAGSGTGVAEMAPTVELIASTADWLSEAGDRVRTRAEVEEPAAEARIAERRVEVEADIDARAIRRNGRRQAERDAVVEDLEAIAGEAGVGDASA